MIKEELESKFEDCFDANTRSSEGGYGPDVTDMQSVWRSFSPMITEYAKQHAIAFANFIAQHDYKPHDIDTWDEGRKNTDEVYDDFIEFQRIEQQTKDK